MNRFKLPASAWQQRALMGFATLLILASGLVKAEATHAQTVDRVRLRPLPDLVRPKFCQPQLESAIASIVDNPRFDTAQWGIMMEPIAEPTVLYQHNSDLALIPASNIKLLTTAAAFRQASDRLLQAQSLIDWITVINQESDNDLADSLLSSIGGQSAVRNTLATLGVNAEDYQQVDGSGLSRSNRAKPSAFVSLLREMYTHDDSGLFYQSLPIAGVNGTLRHRFLDTPVEGKVHAKTGTLNGVKALSGYLEHESYGTIAFSILVNQPEQSGQVLTQAIDQIVLRMAQIDRCD
jgi:serine-type D-Ala-D-Ala carboxypeptidase/endopeptidase (penicillin-binding protein 4)